MMFRYKPTLNHGDYSAKLKSGKYTKFNYVRLPFKIKDSRLLRRAGRSLDVFDLCMVFLLPEKPGKKEFSDMEEILFKRKNCEKFLDDITNDVDKSGSLEILGVPKFNIESSIEDFVEIFQDIGIKEPFSSGADFSKISGFEGGIGKIIHKAVIRIDEVGVEAGAVSVAVVVKGGDEPENFILDRPFLCLLTGKSTRWKENVYFVVKMVKF